MSDFIRTFALRKVTLAKSYVLYLIGIHLIMSTDRHSLNPVAPVADVVDGAVGVGRSRWYVAVVNHNSEKQSAERLEKMGVATYVPAQTEVRVWKNGRKSKVDRIVIPSKVFVYCTEQKRREIVSLPFVFRFMTNSAASSADALTKPLAIIPDAQISRLKFMLGQSDIPVEIGQRSFSKGDRVRVIRGSLKGLEGEVEELASAKAMLVVDMGILGCARLMIDTVSLEPVEK